MLITIPVETGHLGLPLLRGQKIAHTWLISGQIAHFLHGKNETGLRLFHASGSQIFMVLRRLNGFLQRAPDHPRSRGGHGLTDPIDALALLRLVPDLFQVA